MKKIIALVLTLSFAIGAITLPAWAESIQINCDVNGDGLTDNLDSTLILQYDAGIKKEISGGDANGDGDVDNLDAVMVLRQDAGLDPLVKKCDFRARYVRYIPPKYMHDNGPLKEDSSPMILRSTDDLTEFLGGVTELEDHGVVVSSGEFQTFMPYEIYDEEYFENNILLLVMVIRGSGSTRQQVDSVTLDNEGLDVVMEVFTSSMGTTDMAYWTMFIELDKSCDVPRENVEISWLPTYSDEIYSMYGAKAYFAPATSLKDLTEPITKVIYSAGEYNAFISENNYNLDAVMDGYPSYNEVYGRTPFTDSFFKDSVLVAIVTPYLPTTTRYRVEGYSNSVKGVKSLDITVESFEVDYGDENVSGNWIMMLTLDKRSFNEDILKIHFTEHEVINETVAFKETQVRTRYNSHQKVYSHKVDSWLGLNSFYKVYKAAFEFDNGYFGSDSFANAIAGYDDKYFEDNALLIIPVIYGSGSISQTVKSVALNTVNGQHLLNVVIEEYVPFVCTADMAQWFILVEIDKQYLLDDARINVTIETVYEE